jgi:hypothetical protein
MAKKETLFGKLLEAKLINEFLRDNYSLFKRLMNRYEGLPGFSAPELGFPSRIDVKQMELDVMNEYKNNPIFSDAINDVKTVKESLYELAEVNKGLKLWLPRRRDDVHNEKLSRLGELIDEPEGLRTNGIFAPDNFATVGLGLLAGLSTTFIIYAGSVSSGINIFNEIYESMPGIPMVGSCLVLSAGINANLKRLKALPEYQAQFLDEKIAEHYR